MRLRNLSLASAAVAVLSLPAVTAMAQPYPPAPTDAPASPPAADLPCGAAAGTCSDAPHPGPYPQAPYGSLAAMGSRDPRPPAYMRHIPWREWGCREARFPITMPDGSGAWRLVTVCLGVDADMVGSP